MKITPDKRDQLKQKRSILLEKARLKKIEARIADQLNYLDRQDDPYKVYYEHEHLIWLALSTHTRKRDGYHGSHGDFQLDVDDASKKNASIYHENEFQSPKFNAEFTSILPDDLSVVVCYQGGDPEVEISLQAFLSNPLIFFSRMETWIISNDKNWIIEYLWDQPVIRIINLTGEKPILIKKLMIGE